MSERIKKHEFFKLPACHLYVDDLRDICEVLSDEADAVKVNADGLVYEHLDEFLDDGRCPSAVTLRAVHEFRWNGSEMVRGVPPGAEDHVTVMDFIKVHLESGGSLWGAGAWHDPDDTIQAGLTARIGDICERHPRQYQRIRARFGILAYFLSLLTAWGLLAILVVVEAPALGAILFLMVGLPTIVMSIIQPKLVRIHYLKKSDRRSWWSRNRDAATVALLTGVILIPLTVVITVLSENRWGS